MGRKLALYAYLYTNCHSTKPNMPIENCDHCCIARIIDSNFIWESVLQAVLLLVMSGFSRALTHLCNPAQNK